MDPTRISIARVLALDVPLTWQDAVAVTQEAAMLSDVNAAMNARPSLVSPEACVITKAGELELPETTEVESPDAVADLLRALLAGREAPEALDALAYGPSSRDLSADLAAFNVGNRRAVIARLATRALAASPASARPGRAQPAASAEAATPVAATPPNAAPPAPRAPAAPIPFPTPTAPAPPPFVGTPVPAVVKAPPFVATPPRASQAALARDESPTAAASDGPVPEAELRRLRTRTVAREQRNRRWTVRLAQWLTWRPAFPDPRLLGGAVIVVAALVSVLWREAPEGPAAADVRPTAAAALPAAPPPDDDTAREATGPAASAPATSAAASRLGSRPGAPGPTAAAAPGRRPTGVTASPPAATAVEERRATARPTEDTAVAGVPPAAATSAPPSAAPTTAASAPPEARRLPTPPVRTARARTAPYSASDAEVAPPVMLRQQLPSTLLERDTGVPPDSPFLELIIDEQGAVERVRLRARTPAPGETLYRHRMLLAAAKAWQFEPARLDGQPVRYLMRVPLEP